MLEQGRDMQIARLNKTFSSRFGNLTTSLLKNADFNTHNSSPLFKDIDTRVWFPRLERSLLPHYQGYVDFRSGTPIEVFEPTKMVVRASEKWVEETQNNWRRLDPKRELSLFLGYETRDKAGCFDYLCLMMNARNPAEGTRFIYSDERRTDTYQGHDIKVVTFSEQQLEDLYFILSEAPKAPPAEF